MFYCKEISRKFPLGFPGKKLCSSSAGRRSVPVRTGADDVLNCRQIPAVPAGLEGEHIPVHKNQVVLQMDANGGQRRPKDVGHQPVRLGRQGQVAHMVVGHIDPGRPKSQRLLRDPAGIDLSHFNAALGHPPHTQYLALTVQAQNIDLSFLAPKK